MQISQKPDMSWAMLSFKICLPDHPLVKTIYNLEIQNISKQTFHIGQIHVFPEQVLRSFEIHKSIL